MNECWICGKDGSISRNFGEISEAFEELLFPDERLQRCYCEKCFEEVTAQYKADVSEYVRLKKKLMFERAVRILEKQDLEIYDYRDAITAVEEFAKEHPDKFDSSYEMIAAIILVNNEVKCKMQYKIGKYQCDFVIPSLKVVLEIDGERHEHRIGRDSIRDEYIVKALGKGWNVVRIKTEHLDKNASALLDAIHSVLNRRKEKVAQRLSAQ